MKDLLICDDSKNILKYITILNKKTYSNDYYLNIIVSKRVLYILCIWNYKFTFYKYDKLRRELFKLFYYKMYL